MHHLLGVGEEDKAHLALLQKDKHKRKLDPSSGAGGEGPKAIAHTLHVGGARGQGLP